jgi:hypothetical protein
MSATKLGKAGGKSMEQAADWVKGLQPGREWLQGINDVAYSPEQLGGFGISDIA